MNLGNTVLSFVRTFVPVIVGAVVTALQPFGIEVDTVTATAFLTALVTGVYYTVARLAEKHWPAAGWLLGAPKQPVYVEPPAPENPLP